MKSLGGLMFFLGLGSAVLHFLEREFVLLAWIGMWGDQAAWAIRIALAVVGGGLWWMGKSREARSS